MNYNVASQMTQRDYRTRINSPTGTIADSDQFDFDQAGRMISARSQRYTNVVSMSYDYAGRLSTESLGIASQTYTVTHVYDTLNGIKKYIYPDSTPVERTYTDRGQLKQIKYSGSVIDTRTYDLAGRLSTSTYSNGAVTTWNYRTSGSNNDNLLADITTTNPGANKVGTYAYTWDANKNKTSETITNSPLSGHGFSAGATGYDDENRVTTWNRTDNNQSQSWSLSLVGDWNSFNQTGTTPITQTRTHGPTHEFTSFTGTSGGQPANGTITYDAKGNMLTRPASLQSPALGLTWDMDNQAFEADLNGTPSTIEVSFTYDALGRQTTRTESSITLIYIQSGQQTIADYILGSPAATSLYRYVYGSYIDEPVMRDTVAGTVKHFFHRNQQYSITAMTDNAGLVQERYAYSASGEVKFFNAAGTSIPTSNQSNRYTYTGREWDASLAMYYFRARWYDPSEGRFASRDPIGFREGFNLYRNNFSTSNTDPSGLTSTSPPGVNTGKPCLVVMFNHTKLPDWRWNHEATVFGGDVLMYPETQSEILDFVVNSNCCTIYALGHQGGGGNRGGVVNYSDNRSWRILWNDFYPDLPDIVFPNSDFERRLAKAFRLNGCSHCAINIVACGGTTREHTATRQRIADRTGCIVCGSTKTIASGPHDAKGCDCTLGPEVRIPDGTSNFPQVRIHPRWKPGMCAIPTRGGWTIPDGQDRFEPDWGTLLWWDWPE